jgi:hypothetical protein
MANQIGIRTVIFVPAGVTTISNIVLAGVTGLTQAVKANTTWWFRFWIPFSVGATGGVKFEVIVPAAPTLYTLAWRLFQGGTGPGTLLDTAIEAAPASFANAAAGAGSNLMEATLYLINGANPGAVTLEFAQNSSVAAALTILQGGIMEVYQM